MEAPRHYRNGVRGYAGVVEVVRCVVVGRWPRAKNASACARLDPKRLGCEDSRCGERGDIRAKRRPGGSKSKPNHQDHLAIIT